MTTSNVSCPACRHCTIDALSPPQTKFQYLISGCSLHNPQYDFNDDILTTGADFWVELVQSQLA